MIKKYKLFWGVLILILIVILRSIILLPDNNLHLIACDVGQGDGLLLIKGSTQIVIDGGPNNAISSCVANHIPIWDSEIEMVILTNPDFDHYFGLIDLVKRYKVNLFVANNIPKEGQDYKELMDTIRQKNISVSNPLTGTKIKIDKIFIDFVWPAYAEASAGHAPSRSINELSLVFNLKYADFDALFTGDVVPKSIDELIHTGKIYDIDYLKVPHHGSKNGLTQELLDLSNPEIAVISDGRNNRYGHPSPEVIKMLIDKAVKILRTDQQGEIEIVSDGKSWWLN